MKYLDQNRGASENPPREYLTAIRRITVAELLAIDTNPVVMIPAPGPGKAIVPLTIFGKGEGGVAYDQADGNLAMRYENGAEAIQLLDTFAGADAPFSYFGPPTAGFVTLRENEAVVIATDAPGAGDLTLGDYPIEIRIEYQIVDV